MRSPFGHFLALRRRVRLVRPLPEMKVVAFFAKHDHEEPLFGFHAHQERIISFLALSNALSRRMLGELSTR